MVHGCRGWVGCKLSERSLDSIVELALIGVVLGECCDESRYIRSGKRTVRDWFCTDVNFISTSYIYIWFEGCIVLGGACALAAFLGRHCRKNKAYGRIGSEQQRRGSCVAAAQRIADSDWMVFIQSLFRLTIQPTKTKTRTQMMNNSMRKVLLDGQV